MDHSQSPHKAESQNHLSKLPHELTTMIFKSLPDMKSVLSFALTSRSAHAIFEVEKLHIARNFIRAHKETLKYAVTALEAKDLRPEHDPHTGWYVQALDGSLVSFDAHIEAFLKNANLSQLLRVLKYHREAHLFAEKLARLASKRGLKKQAGENERPIHPQEISRTERALHMLELYGVRFGNACEKEEHAPYQTPQEFNLAVQPLKAFCSQFATWEVTELVCLLQLFGSAAVKANWPFKLYCMSLSSALRLIRDFY